MSTGLDSKWLALALISTAMFLIGIDMTVLYTALPTLTRELNASNTQKLWIINAYPLVMAGLLPGLGTLGDRVGHRLIFIWGLVAFGVASLFAAFAPSAGALIVGRAFIAVGAAMMTPATLSLLRQAFTGDRDRAIAIGVWGSVASGAAALGPIIGGGLLEHFWWGSVFLINVPVVFVALLLTPLTIPYRPGNPTRVWDPGSSALIMVALLGLIYALKEVVKPDANAAHAAVAAATGTASLALFGWRQGRSSSPMIDFALFRIPRFTAGVMTALVSMIPMMGVQLALTQHLQLVQGFTPLQSGAFVLPISLASFFAGPIVGSALHRIGIGRALWISLFVAAFGHLGFLLVLREGSVALQVFSMVLFGFGAGGGMAVASTAIMISTPEDKAGMAASIEGVSYEVGGALGVAIMGSIMTFVYSKAILLPPGLGNAGLAKDSLDQALLLARHLDGGQAGQLLKVARSSFDNAFVAVVMAGTAILAALGGVLLAFVKADHDPTCTPSTRGSSAAQELAARGE